MKVGAEWCCSARRVEKGVTGTVSHYSVNLFNSDRSPRLALSLARWLSRYPLMERQAVVLGWQRAMRRRKLPWS